MSWYNPFSWGGGGDEANPQPMRDWAMDVGREARASNAEAMKIGFGVTAEDQQNYGESYGFMRDMVMNDLRTKLPGLLQDVSGQAGARGLSGSAVEQGLRQRAGLAAQRQAGDIMSQYGAQQAGIMQQGALQRGQAQLSRNQMLWQNLLQSYQPILGVEQMKFGADQERIQNENNAFSGLLGTGTAYLTNRGKKG